MDAVTLLNGNRDSLSCGWAVGENKGRMLTQDQANPEQSPKTT